MHPRSIEALTSPSPTGQSQYTPVRSAGSGFDVSQTGQVLISDKPSRIKEKHLKIWGEILNLDILTTLFSASIKVARMLYILRPHVNSQPWGVRERASLTAHYPFSAVYRVLLASLDRSRTSHQT